jgi:transposase
MPQSILNIEWLPKYAPELNDIEIVWGELIRLSPISTISTTPFTTP